MVQIIFQLPIKTDKQTGFKDVLHRCRKNIFEALIYAVKMVGEP